MTHKYEDDLRGIKNRLQEIKTNQGSWFNRLSESIELARHSYASFEIGSPDDKRELLAKLGSNLFMNDGKVSIKLDEPYFIAREILERERALFTRIEPLGKPLFDNKKAPCGALVSVWSWGLEQYRNYFLNIEE